jgi:brachyury protein
MNLNQLLDVVSPDLNGTVEKLEGLESKCAVKLEEKELWSKFKEFTNEMIVTKNGR